MKIASVQVKRPPAVADRSGPRRTSSDSCALFVLEGAPVAGVENRISALRAAAYRRLARVLRQPDGERPVPRCGTAPVPH